MSYHTPVLLTESIEGLRISSNGTYVDATFGGGGHSLSILKGLQAGVLYAFDQDETAKKNLVDDARLVFVHSNYAFLKNFLMFYGVDGVDGILADLGVSSHHFDAPERGFSFRFDAPLDMRMNTSAEKSAYDVLNSYDISRLCYVFREYGELKQAYQIARAICEVREIEPIRTTTQLKEIGLRFFPAKQEIKLLSQLFQAIRIEVNNEMGSLQRFLCTGLEMLKPGGRFVVITYHSLEDRLVKNFFKTGNTEGVLEKDFFGHVQTPFVLITKKVCVPTEDEIQRNPRARSAKLRIAEKK